MKISVISDIHGNLEAFVKVLDDIDTHRADSVISLGDNIGYGPDPAKVMALKPRVETGMKGNKMDINEKVMTKGLLIDDAMGSMLISQGLSGAQAPELWNIEHPDRILEIHQAYCDAGADVITAKHTGHAP